FALKLIICRVILVQRVIPGTEPTDGPPKAKQPLAGNNPKCAGNNSLVGWQVSSFFTCASLSGDLLWQLCIKISSTLLKVQRWRTELHGNQVDVKKDERCGPGAAGVLLMKSAEVAH
ncbi:MAG: hypothetical protein PHP60_06955, partial [Bacteroidales bacterium]|nr:hypothetical protein [Bacteroidales bacterium]